MIISDGYQSETAVRLLYIACCRTFSFSFASHYTRRISTRRGSRRRSFRNTIKARKRERSIPYDVAVTRSERWLPIVRRVGGGMRKGGSNGTMPGVADPSFLDPLNFGWYHLLAVQCGEQQMTLRFHTPGNRMSVFPAYLFLSAEPPAIQPRECTLGKIQTNRRSVHHRRDQISK